MTNKWRNDSEYLTGLALQDKISPDAIDVSKLFPPFDQIILMKRQGMDATAMMLKGIPFTELNGALLAGEVVNPSSALDLIRAVETDAVRAIGGARLRKQAEKLEKGEEADAGIILQVAASLDSGYGEMTPMSKVEPAGDMFVKTGYQPFDEHFGGIPMASMTVLAASPGVGKTSLALRVAAGAVRLHKDKNVAIFTLEMLMSQLTKRALEIDSSLTEEEKDRILLSEEIMGPDEVYAMASRTAATYPLSMIIIDFADYMVEGEQSESVMGKIYKTIATLAKRSGVPVLLLSQLNRETYTGGIPKIHHIRYSGLAEATAAMILLVYNPQTIFVDVKSNSLLPSISGVGYVIVGKSRYGYVYGQPTAAQIPWNGLEGWGDEALGHFELGG